MKIIALKFIFFISLFLPLRANEVGEVLENWRLSSPQFSDTEALLELQVAISTAVPDAGERLRQMHEVVNAGPEGRETETGMLFLALWHGMAPPEVRAEFVSGLLASSSDPIELRIIEAYLKADLIDRGNVPKELKWRDWIEMYYDASAYAKSDIKFNSRLAALLFSVAPGAVLRDVAGVSQDAGFLKILEQAESLRFKLEDSQSLEDWDSLQSVLKQLSDYDDLAVRAYLARVVAWIRDDRVFAEFKVDEAVLKSFESDESSLVSYLLNSNQPKDLLKIPGNEASEVRRSDVKPPANPDGGADHDPEAVVAAGDPRQVGDGSADPSQSKSDSENLGAWLIAGLVLCGIALILFLRRSLGRTG